MKSRKRGVKVLAFGTFDLLHKGHISYLEQAKSLGDKLYVLVACDQAVEWAKKHHSEERAAERLEKVKKLTIVDVAWIGNPVRSIEDYLKPIIEIKPDIVCLGYDQALEEEDWLRREVDKLEPKPKLVRLRAFQPEAYKTSIIKKGRPR